MHGVPQTFCPPGQADLQGSAPAANADATATAGGLPACASESACASVRDVALERIRRGPMRAQKVPSRAISHEELMAPPIASITFPHTSAGHSLDLASVPCLSSPQSNIIC